MNLGKWIFNTIKLILSAFGVLLTFYAVLDFTYFLSVPNYKIKVEPIPEGNKFIVLLFK